MLISWGTTNRCDLRCPHCYRNAGQKLEQELTTEEAFKLLGEIKQAGFQLMIFSGGEPLLRDDIYELIARARLVGLRPALGTNGGLIDLETATKLKKSGLAAAGVSLDSVKPEQHDAFRGVEGLFERVSAAFRALKEVGIAFQIHMTIMDWNQDEIEDLIEYSVSVGARACHLFFVVPVGRAESFARFSGEEYEALIGRIMRKSEEVPIEVKPVCAPQFVPIAAELGVKTRFSTGCLAGTDYCFITPVGDVQPCAYLEVKAGNVRDKSFAEIWAESEVFTQLRSLEWEGHCGVCAYRASCRGCRARAYCYTGNYLAADPLCRGS